MIGWQASAFIVTYPVNNAIDKEGNETGRAVAWEKAFIQIVKVWTLDSCFSNFLVTFCSNPMRDRLTRVFPRFSVVACFFSCFE